MVEDLREARSSSEAPGSAEALSLEWVFTLASGFGTPAPKISSRIESICDRAQARVGWKGMPAILQEKRTAASQRAGFQGRLPCP